uniref:Uncharacterized protein n=1 Tax=Physcomitrium patens TaxID=3218 RepID=A0A2K1J8R4_PHYPA|nr:hypothetical protein PHYPA_021024 [Physcomitrium patens]
MLKTRRAGNSCCMSSSLWELVLLGEDSWCSVCSGCGLASARPHRQCHLRQSVNGFDPDLPDGRGFFPPSALLMF